MTRVLLLALVLSACTKQQPPEVVDEVRRRAEFVRKLSEREHRLDAWSLNSREDISFEDGMSNPVFIDKDDPEARWFEIVRNPSLRDGDAVRWMNRSVHFRVRGETDMVFEIRGKILTKKVFTHPRIELTIGGELIESKLVDDDGRFTVRTIVSSDLLTDWVDVYVTFSSLQEPSREAGPPEVARLEWVEWEPVGTSSKQP
ncbi:MAG: hypothetical protein SFX73_30005 [Kofleriaceae bacterium]|nr:hypothetical protein [Kofleriaceae bacterium]